MSSNNSSSSSTLSILGFVDGLWELNKVAKIIYFTLCFDILFFYIKGNGLFGIRLGKEFDLSIADMAGMIIVLGIFSSILLKVVSLLFSLFLIKLRYSDLFKSTEDIYKKSAEEVSFVELRDDALANGDDLSYKIYVDECKKQDEIIKGDWSNEVISFGVALAFSIEWYLSASDGQSRMFIDWLWEHVKSRDPEITHHYIGMFVSALLIAYATFICWPREVQSNVYYPKLARKLQREKEERKRNLGY